MSLKSSHSLLNYYLSLHHFVQYPSLGRYRLARLLQLTQDQTRPLIEYLVDKRLIKKISRREGHSISQLGKKVLCEFEMRMHISTHRVFFGSDYTLGTKDAAVCLNASLIDYVNTVDLRDEALLAGSKGCTVFFQTSNRDIFLLDVIYPPLPKSPLSSRKVKKRIFKVTQDLSWKNTVVIIGTADTYPLALRGALAAGLLFVTEQVRKPFL